LEDDEEVIDDCEHGSTRLYWDCAIIQVIAVIIVCGTIDRDSVIMARQTGWAFADCRDILDHYNDGSTEDKDEGEKRKSTSTVQSNKQVGFGRQHFFDDKPFSVVEEMILSKGVWYNECLNIIMKVSLAPGQACKDLSELNCSR